MIKSYTGAVRGQNETKYDLLRAPRDSLLVFCLTSDYQYPVMNINYSGIYGRAKRPNLHSILQPQTVKIIEIMELDDTLRFFNQKEREVTYAIGSRSLNCKG